MVGREVDINCLGTLSCPKGKLGIVLGEYPVFICVAAVVEGV